MFSIFGEITPPEAIAKLESKGGAGNGIFAFLNIIFKVIGAVAGIYFVVQIILAGFAYLSASGDEKKTANAWATIWQSIMGLVIVASAFVIAGVVGTILNIDILNPKFD